MQLRQTIVLALLACPLVLAENADKAALKDLQSQAKAMVKEAKTLEKQGQLVEARKEYAQSEAVFETNDAVKGVKRVDDKLQNQVKDALAQARTLYDGGNFHAAASKLESALLLETSTALLQQNLALCYYRAGDPAKAVESLDQAIGGTPDPKLRQKLQLLRTTFVTGETGTSLQKGDKQRIADFNQSITNLGFGTTLDDPAVDPDSPDSPATATPTARLARVRPCIVLEDLKSNLSGSASATFDLANCAETNLRPDQAAKLLQHYLELAPKALDGDEVRTRLGELEGLRSLPGANGDEVRKLYAAASRSIEERRYDRALADLLKAATLAPDFALVQWKLGLFYEAMGNVQEARRYFASYRQLKPGNDDQYPVDLHLSTLDARRTKYDEEVGIARDALAELLRRSLNLTSDLSPTGRGFRAERARAAGKNDKKAMKQVGGFAVPFAYARQQLSLAAGQLQLALSLFPLGAEANELMALVYLQANDGSSAMRCFDAVAGQSLPVAFYAECRGHKLDHAARCELSPNGLRLIFLSSYDKKGRPAPPDRPAGKDGLGDLVLAPRAERQDQFDALPLAQADIRQVETKNGMVRLKLADQEITLSPIFMASLTPVEGPPARRFANTYTRLLIRYPGLEDSKLGKEGLTGMEKVKLGAAIAQTSADMAFAAWCPWRPSPLWRKCRIRLPWRGASTE